MERIDNIIKSITEIFNVSEERVSSLSAMLSEIESNNLYAKFSVGKQYKKYSDADLISKANLLNALLGIVLENSDIKRIDEGQRKRLLIDLCRTIASLYEQVVLDVKEEESWNHISYLVMYSMLSYIADMQTISDLIIREYLSKLNKFSRDDDDMLPVEILEQDTFLLVVLLLSNIKNSENLIQITHFIDMANASLKKAQEEELKRDIIDVPTALKISSYGNIVFLTSILKDYLFSGRIENTENQDLNSVIDMYSYNAFHLLDYEDIELRLIGLLIRYAYRRVVENSIWNIAYKSPLIKDFIINNLSEGNRYFYSLLPSQRDVISDVLAPKKSIIVGMPTSGGKSILAEMQILFSIHNFSKGEFKPTVCYIVPTNALISQVKRDLQNDFKTFGFNIETALPYYDVDEIENDILTRNHVDILISTPEKLESLIRQNHPAVRDTRLVVMDEAHNIGDEFRGSKFELVLSIVKHNIKDANFLLLSPFIDNSNDISEWLADSPRNATVLSVEWAPTRQYIGCNLLNDKKDESVMRFYKSPRNMLGTENVEIALRLNPQDVKKELGEKSINNYIRLAVVLNDFIEQDGNILVLCGGKGTAPKQAMLMKEFFYKRNMLPDLRNDEDVERAIEIVKLENGEDDNLIDCLKNGVCYHHAGLSNMVREVIEELVRDNKMKIIFATTTLAQGMNLPINTIVFDTVKLRGKGFLTKAEFWNIAGRAGRAYKDKEGYIIVSFSKTKKNTEALVKDYIKYDLHNIVSSLNAFFSGDREISFDYNVLKESSNAPILNLLQYINHILNISYDYNIKPDEISKIRGILNDSYLYHSLSKQEGFINAQTKLNSFVAKYIRHINNNKKEDMVKADELGICDVSYTKVRASIGAFINRIKEEGYKDYKASEVILETRNIDRLTEIIDIISRIPEINISMSKNGAFDARSVAQLLMGWVNGKRVVEIARDIKRVGQSVEEVVSLCNSYLNSQMKSYMPWGMNIYQTISYDLQTEKAQMLPSFIYYGVSSREAVIVSRLGVPRFAVDNVLRVLKDNNPDMIISVENMDKIKNAIRDIRSDEYIIEKVSGKTIKEIVDERIMK